MLDKKLSEKYNIKTRRLFIMVEMEIAVLLVIMVFFLRVALVRGNIDVLADETNIPVVSAEGGYLKFNSVRVSVPAEGASYSIGYDWTDDDQEYPSIPSSASASYNGDDDNLLYEILLYRETVTPKDEGDTQNTIDTWFEKRERRSGTVDEQEVYETPNTKGFLMIPSEDAPADKNTYCSYAYYFAVETDDSIEQYVLELDYYDRDSTDEAETLIKACADSIYLMKKVAS